MELPLEIQEKIFCTYIETLIISQFLNTDLRKLTNAKFNKLDRNLLLTNFTRSEGKFNVNKNLLVIHIPNNESNIKYEKRLTSDCFLITSTEYLRLICNNIDIGRVSYVYGRKITSQVYVHPCKMIVKKEGGILHVFRLSKNESSKDICDSKDYIKVNFITLFGLCDDNY